MYHSANFQRIIREQPLTKPGDLLGILPLDENLLKAIYAARATIAAIIKGQDPRLLVIVGPCSIHDEPSALEYAARLQAAAREYENELYIVMRTYFSKPRTTLGWKGLVYDPLLDQSYDMEQGLFLTRKILLAINKLLPTACEFLDMVTPSYLRDLISWCAIGARTSASQSHRELASGLPMPVGFKNSVDGNIQIAIHAAESARSPHHYFGFNAEGQPALIQTQGNDTSHIILRGSLQAANYSASHIRLATEGLQAASLEPRVIIDCSHDNSGKQYAEQMNVVEKLTQFMQDEAQEFNSFPLCGVMLESYLHSGKQAVNHPESLTYGLSITDSCLSWEETVPLFEKLALAMRKQMAVRAV